MLDGSLWIFVSTVLPENPEASSACDARSPRMALPGLGLRNLSIYWQFVGKKRKKVLKGGMIGDDMRNAMNMLR